MIPNLSEHLFDRNQKPVPLLSAEELLALEKEMIKVREVHFYSALNSWIEMTAEVLSLHPSIFDATIKLSDTFDECMGWVYQPFELRSDNYLPCYGVCYFQNKQTGTNAPPPAAGKGGGHGAFAVWAGAHTRDMNHSTVWGS